LVNFEYAIDTIMPAQEYISAKSEKRSNMNKLNGIILVTVLALWIAFCGTATASQLYVNESGWWRDGDMFNASSAPIQSAVDGATDGDSIFVRSGSYSGNVGIDKDWMLEGKDQVATIIDGGGRS